MMQLITAAPDLRGKSVVVRTSANVPLAESGQVLNDYRLKQALPTLKFLRQAGARTIVLAHIGRDQEDSLKPVATAWAKMIPLTWGGQLGSEELTKAREAMQDGDILLVENLRQDPSEADNDPQLAAELAALGEIYVDDAFDNIHREHASMVGLPALLPSYAGLTLAAEVNHITAVMEPKHPSLFILGGAKFETKLPLLEKYLNIYDHVFVGGALANDILLADGYEVGQSLVSSVALAGQAFLQNPKLLRPVDLVVTGPNGRRVVEVEAVAKDECIIDIGPASVEQLALYIAGAKTILWNGPLSRYEPGVPDSTQAVAKLVAASPAFSVIGGGDTVAAVEALGLNDQFGFVSTGGGAMLTLLEAGNTPALQALGYTG